MAGIAHHGTLRAEEVLPVESEQEALDLDSASITPDPVHRVAAASSYQRRNSAVLAWRRHISISVPHDKCRDHLANERTALGYIRTAQAFAMLGVIIAQVTRLYRSPTPDPVLGFFVVSVPLASACHGIALLITLLGCYRFLHWQEEMVRGHAISSGWEIHTIFAFSIAFLVSMFCLVVIISIRRD